MPSIGGNNPAGENGLPTSDGIGNLPYGERNRLENLRKAAPLPAVPGVTAPRQSQRRAVRGYQSPQNAQRSPAPTLMSPEEELGVLWSQVASLPGANDIVRLMAGEFHA